MNNIKDIEPQYESDEALNNVIFTGEGVMEKLARLKPSAAPGPDKVWAKVLHSLAAVLAEPLALLFCT